jgi:hypothetical protein
MFFVKYRIHSFLDECLAGPYDTYEEARYQADDIRGYEGVYDVRIETQEEDSRGIDLTGRPCDCGCHTPAGAAVGMMHFAACCADLPRPTRSVNN